MKNILPAIIVICCVTAAAQEKQDERFILRGGIGYDIPLNPHSGTVTDYLSGIHQKGISLPKISASWFITNNWGIELLFQGVVPRNGDKYLRQAEELLQQEMGDNYFLSDNIPYYDLYVTPARIAAGAGVSYKIETKRFILLPKLLAGVTAIDREYLSYTLKEKDANDEWTLTYESKHRSLNGVVSVGYSAELLYRLSNVRYISLDAAMFHHRAGTDYQRMVTNRITGETTTERIRDNRMIHRLNISIGFGFELSKRRKRN